MNKIKVGKNWIGKDCPTYFIADIAANHDGNINRAKKLISIAKDCGADAVKFQHHNVDKYVSDFGFKNLGKKFSHQKKWKKTIFEVYEDAQVPTVWTDKLKKHADKINIDFFSTPYDLDMVDHLNRYVCAYKVGSGDINWDAMLMKVAKKNKPIMFASGAANIFEVQRAMSVIKKHNLKIVLMQCNTNYTGSTDNFNYININVLNVYKTMFPDTILGLSDHTPGDVTVLGAVACGAKVIEKHFTDDTKRPGPDHPFSMDPSSWRKMVERTRILEKAMGKTTKEVEENERDTVVLQRRAIRIICDLKSGSKISRKHIQFQRPAPVDSFPPNSIDLVLNKILIKDIKNGDYLRAEHFSA